MSLAPGYGLKGRALLLRAVRHEALFVRTEV
jgi:hypothetical protein